ncbi:MAG: hypothetical protein SGJ20_09570 [Planctomycetota bacterium]|nr:hypothetical protein [Planctomycetota bacterium]
MERTSYSRSQLAGSRSGQYTQLYRLFVSLLAVTMVAGCSASRPSSANRAVLHDCSPPRDFDTGYSVIAVDGRPVERASHPIHTVVPQALIPAGTHTLALDADDDPTKVATVTAHFEAGKSYQLEMTDGQLGIAECSSDSDSESPNAATIKAER